MWASALLAVKLRGSVTNLGTLLCSSPGPHSGEAAWLEEEKASSEQGVRSEVR